MSFGNAIHLRLWVARETFYIILTFTIDFASLSILFIGVEGIAPPPPQAHWEDLLRPEVKVIFFGHWSRCERVNMAGSLFYLVIGIKPPTCFQTDLTHHNNLVETVEFEWPSITQGTDLSVTLGDRQGHVRQPSRLYINRPLITLNCAGQHPQQVPTSNGG